MSASLTSRLGRSVLLPYFLVFLVVLGTFAIGVRSVVAFFGARQSFSRLEGLARAASGATDVGNAGHLDIGDEIDQVLDPRDQGIEWLDSAGHVVARRGRVPDGTEHKTMERWQRLRSAGGIFDLETIPLIINGTSHGYLRVSQSTTPFDRLIQWVDGSLIVGLAFGAGASFLGGRYLSFRALSRIEEGVKTLEDFSANAAHELRSPLAAIRANAEVALRADGFPIEHRPQVETIVATATAMQHLINDLLTLSSPATYEPSELDIIDLAAIVDRVISTQWLDAGRRSVCLIVKIDRPVSIRGREYQVERIVANLVENAIRYTNGGEVTVRCYAERGNALLHVQDSGIGISPADQPHIFERFWRADHSYRPGAGSGLGLSIARFLVLRHAGSIRVESTLDVGSEFTVAFPLAHLAAG